MKKLMIAAAAAAMIGGAYAEVYDFTASVKTTQGKYGSQKTSYTVYLGLDDTGTYWWDAEGWLNEKTAKAEVKKMTNDEKAYFAWINLEFDGVSTKYDNKEFYKGKWVWCYSFKFTDLDENCYRIPGSAKLSGTVLMDECCGTWEFISYDFGMTVLADDLAVEGVSEIFHPLLYRINGISLGKANKVEVTGTFGDGGLGYDGSTIGTFAYAGQGTFDVKNDRISNISGNLVGILENPECEDCCNYNDDAVVFECNDDADSITDGPTNDQLLGTAAFGTFSMKLNKKLNSSRK